MSRLIDADKLIEEMSKWYWDKEKQKAAEEDESPMDLFTHLAIITVQEQPTAFDVDKVVDQLEKEESKARLELIEDRKTAFEFSSKCRLEAYEKAIEIVKGGGVE